MNKARMTFKFPQDRGKDLRPNPEERKVIPLRTEEYRVIQEELLQKVDAVDQGEKHTDFLKGFEAGPSAKERERIKPLNDFTSDYGGWQSSFDIETQRVEDAIRASREPFADPETGYVERAADHGQQHSNWGGLPDPEQEESMRPRESRGFYRLDAGEPVRYAKQPGGTGTLLKIVASAAGAVVTGVAFGFLVLSMFTGGDEAPAAKQQASAGTAAAKPSDKQAAAAVPATAAAALPASAPAAAPADGVTLKLSAKSYTVLQGGVFSSLPSAEAEAANFRKKGLAAVTEAGEKYTVYVGLGASRDEALGLSQPYDAQSIDVMVKSYEIPAASKVRWSGSKPELFADYLTQGDKLVKLISAQTALHAAESAPAALEEKAFQAIKSAHQTWAQSVSAVSEGLGDGGKAALPKMNSALNTAVVSLEEYKKNPSSSFIWQAQTAILQFVLAEKELLKAVAVQ